MASDAARVHALIRSSGGLDVNSLYAYLLLCTHFANTSAIAEAGGTLVGFAGGYRKPDEPDAVFVWQIAVDGTARGRGVGRGLLTTLLCQPGAAAIRYLEATITPSNKASWALFRSFARSLEADCHTHTMFRQADFGGHDHEEEELLRIGPFHPQGGDTR